MRQLFGGLAPSLAVLYFAGLPAFAQIPQRGAAQQPELPRFAVISVRQSEADNNVFRVTDSPEGVTIRNASLLMILRGAYGMFTALDEKFIGVPDWAKTTKYDIEAKVDPADLDRLHSLKRSERDAMLQGLLADRFQLRVHSELREQAIYLLTVAKSGSKLNPARPGETYEHGLKDPYNGATGPGVVVRSPRSIEAQAITLSNLVVMLTQIVGRTVEDRTGLAGTYDLSLNWTPDALPPTSTGSDTVTSANDSGPSIFTAVQEQLGLKLESTKGSVPVLVIDHVERPAEN